MMETRGITMKLRGAVRVLPSLALLGVLLTWTGPRPAEAEAALNCTNFQDWNEVDGFFMLFWAGDDPEHRHDSAGTTHPNDYQLLRIVKAVGYQHTDMLEHHTIPSGEHGDADTCTGMP